MKYFAAFVVIFMAFMVFFVLMGSVCGCYPPMYYRGVVQQPYVYDIYYSPYFYDVQFLVLTPGMPLFPYYYYDVRILP